MAKGGHQLVMILALVVLAVLAAAEGMVITLENDMAESSMAVHCHSKYEGDLGLQYVNPSGVYCITVPGKFVSGKQYWCTFEAAEKPSTTFDVFRGWGGVKNWPCNCVSDSCPWRVTASGFSCHDGKFSRSWGS